jgi:hypothetical protein
MRSREETPVKRGRIHEYLSFRAAVKTDAGTAATAPTDESKVRIARNPAIGSKSFFLDLPFTGGSTATSLPR